MVTYAVGDENGCNYNPVETLSSLYINDTLHSRRSLGSNASSHRSSSSNGSAGSAASWSQQLPSFHRPLKFVSRPPDLHFAAMPSQASPGKAGDFAAACGAARDRIRRRNRRNPSVVVEDADKAAFEQLVGQRRVRKSFMFGRKSGNSRQAINNLVANGAERHHDPPEGKTDMLWVEPAPVDYAQTVSARSAQGWQVAARLKAMALLPRTDSGRSKGAKDAAEPVVPDGKESPVDVEMSSKPPSRESSFRGDEETKEGSSTGGETTNDDGPAAAATAQSEPQNGNGGEVGRTPAAGGNVDSKKRVYGCTVPDCGKVYTKSSHLKSHMRSHTG